MKTFAAAVLLSVIPVMPAHAHSCERHFELVNEAIEERNKVISEVNNKLDVTEADIFSLVDAGHRAIAELVSANQHCHSY